MTTNTIVNNRPQSITAAAAAIRAGRLTSAELVERCLDRIARLDAKVHAWVMVDEYGARETARAADAALRRGVDCGALHGIPIGIKDIVDVKGWPTLAGSRLREGHCATADAPIVERLRDAGAIILGKTVTTEFASFDPPPTRNPWNLDRTPGGSSSGSAAAVATGMCFGAVGSQTGGSIIRPAGYCGICGMKPSYGQIPLEGIVPLAFHLDHPGPLARTVSDLELLWSIMAAACSSRASSRYSDLAEPPGSHERETDTIESTHSPRLGLVRPYFLDEADEAVRQATLVALNNLSDAGAEIVDAALPESFAELRTMHRRMMAVEAAEYHRTFYAEHRDEFGPEISRLLDEGLAATAVDYAQALVHHRHFQTEIDDRIAPFDALVMPATVTTAPGRETTGDPKFTSPWSYAGLPVLTVPCGLAPDGLPCGLQLVARRLEERALFNVGRWCERVLEFQQLPSILGA